MKIKLPEKFDEILDGKYRAIVDFAISRFSDIYVDNKLEFFQEYTDHGFKHIEEVLESAVNIIDNDTFKYLNEKDIFVLVISILLHDLGMHISKEGLKKIFDPQFDKYRVKEFDNKSWLDEWNNFYQEAKRFNDDQLINIFGDADQTISEPNLDSLDDYSRKIYGEFLRINHHRLAHEIAVGGFPTQIGCENVFLTLEDIEQDLIDIAGTIARSHGIPLRNANDYLEKRYKDAWRTPYDIKVVFLMVVLRIADYLQIHSSRASKILLKSKSFDSPISQKEWEKHNSIKDINIRTADPERIFVRAKPASSIIYLELDKLFKSIQSELDISWAVLGEAYGKDEDLRNLKIRFRRIRSVLDEKEEFNKTVEFVPERVFFNADPALLKLLIGPLYGEDPKYGVRELLQNSIDAIKEREFLNDIQGQVEITLKAIKEGKPRYELIISDTGIGMTKDTIINYFFKAGASFRKSMAWKKNFIDDDEVKIQKTGRFGVGVLAVFLLGDEFEIWTKYDSTSSQGYYCKASLGMTQVELLKSDCNVGTQIRIRLKEEVNNIINQSLRKIENLQEDDKILYLDSTNLLEWFSWYVMDKPKIKYNIDKKIKALFSFIDKSKLLSSIPESTSKNWCAFSTKEYKSIHWILDKKKPNSFLLDQELYLRDSLVCNGFKINNGYSIKRSNYNWTVPRISIFDNNSKFPLGLNRDYLIEDRLPFEEELLHSISLEIIKAILKTEFITIGSHFIAKPNYLGFARQFNISEYIIVLGDEFTILNPAIFSFLNLSSFNQFWLKLNHKLKNKYTGILSYQPYQAYTTPSTPIKFYRPILENNFYYRSNLNSWFNIDSHKSEFDFLRHDTFSRIYISTDKMKYLRYGKRLSKSFKERMTQNKINNHWSEIINSKSNQISTNIDITNIDSDLYPIIIENFIQTKNNESEFFIGTWEKLLNGEWTFPIDKSKRPNISKLGK